MHHEKIRSKILSIGILIAMLAGFENQAIARNWDTTRIDSARISPTVIL